MIASTVENSRGKSVAIMGTPVSSGNRGVLALGSSLAGLCVEHAEAKKLRILVGNANDNPFPIKLNGKPSNVEVVNYRLSPRSRFRDHLIVIAFASAIYRLLGFRFVRHWLENKIPWIRAIVDSDIVGDVRGGDSFSDIYGLKRFLLASLAVYSVIWVKGSITLFPQTYGPFKSKIARLVARRILKNADIVIARDEDSRAVARSLDSTKEILLTPDVAFSLTPESPGDLTLDPDTDIENSTLIGINVNGLMFNGGYNRNNMFGLSLDYPSLLRSTIEKLGEICEGKIILIPHTYAPDGDVESDNEAAMRLRETLSPGARANTYIVTSEHDQHQIKGIIGKCDFFIGSRMHSCIAALSQSIPCVGVAYSMKFLGVFRSVGMEDWVVDARKCSTIEAERRIIDLYLRRSKERPHLEKSVSKAKRDLEIAFKTVFEKA